MKELYKEGVVSIERQMTLLTRSGPDGGECIKTFGCGPGQSLLLDLVLYVSRSHVNCQGCSSIIQ